MQAFPTFHLPMFQAILPQDHIHKVNHHDAICNITCTVLGARLHEALLYLRRSIISLSYKTMSYLSTTA